MNFRPTELVLAVGAVAYLIALSFAMANVSFDVWGALVTAPLLIVIGMLLVRRLFRGDLQHLQRIMWLGLLAKLVGCLLRYWIAFDTYGGSTDAVTYHNFARQVAGEVWSGEASLSAVLPSGTGTAFIERFTALVYTTMGSSKLAAYLFFGWLSFFGAAFFVRAACHAIPGLAQRRYAGWCVLMPSLVYWPSSIGKEAWMMLTLGIGTFGIARLVSGGALFKGLLITAIGLGGAAFVRPHIAGVWLAGLLPALLVALFRRRSPDRTRGVGLQRFGLVLVIGVAVVALGSVAATTVRYLNPDGDEAKVDSSSITDILNETTRRTSESGSTYTPPAISGPQDWPFASIRTLVRPLLTEVSGFAQLISALEMTIFFACVLIAYRRLLHLPRLLMTNPYVAFAMSTVFLGGLAYASFANLGVLTRQKSLLLPLLVLLPCLPPLPARGTSAATRRTDDQPLALSSSRAN